MDATSRLEVDLGAIAQNIGAIRQLVGPKVGICSVLKADAYSLGAKRIAKRLETAGVEMMAVYTPEQARELIEGAIRTPVLVLMPVRAFARNDVLYRALVQNKLHLTLHDASQLEALAQFADRFGLVLPVHLEFNAGLNRGGARPEKALGLLRRIAELRRVKLAGVLTHFSCADSDPECTKAEARDFFKWINDCADLIPDDCLIHQSSTFGLLQSCKFNASMIRVGICLFGYGAEDVTHPESCANLALAESLTPSVRWMTRLVHTANVEPGESVGYGASWTADRPGRLALAPIGYADGYPTALSNKAMVGIIAPSGETYFAPVVGRVSMDQLTVDVTEIDESVACVGAEVEIVGADRLAPNHLPTLAKQAGMITHEFLARLNPRLQRVYKAADPMVGRKQILAQV